MPYGADDDAFVVRARRAARRARRRAAAPPIVDDEAVVPYRRLRARSWRPQTRRALRPSGVLRLGDHRRRRRPARPPGSRELLPADRRRRRAGRSRAPCSRSSAVRPARRSPTSGCSPARCGSRDRVRPGDDAGRSRRSACSTAARPSRRPSVARRADRQALGPRRHPDRRHARRAVAPTSAAPLRAADAGDGRRTPTERADKGALHVALAQLAEQDPLINLRQDDVRQELFVSLYGEVQKEVIQATLADEFGIDVEFRETTTICIERPVGTGAAVELIDTPPNPFLATVGLRVEPAPVGTRRDVPARGRARLACRSRSSGRSRRPCRRRCGRDSTAGRSPTARSR